MTHAAATVRDTLRGKKSLSPEGFFYNRVPITEFDRDTLLLILAELGNKQADWLDDLLQTKTVKLFGGGPG